MDASEYIEFKKQANEGLQSAAKQSVFCFIGFGTDPGPG